MRRGQGGGKLIRKIDPSVKGDCPTRISEYPYIIREHHEVDSATLRRKNVDGLADCRTCHPDAEAGRFDAGDR